MRVIIADDELPLLHEFKKILLQCPEIEIVGAYADPFEAYMEVEKTRPDTAFLDIEMPGMNGIVLAEKLVSKVPDMDILFVTAYNHYASEAFEANAIDYILKPVYLERLQKALNRLRKKKGTAKPETRVLLRIQSFGKFGAYIGDEPLKWARPKQQELFAYLLQNEGQWVDKYKICDDLWRDNDPDQALASLQTAVWAVRKALKDAGLSCIKIEFFHDSYILHLKEAQWDLRRFDAAYKDFMDTGNIECRREAINLYQKEYLFNEDWLWSVLERAKYARQYEELVRGR
jgi:two-component SAPR family response regulator